MSDILQKRTFHTWDKSDDPASAKELEECHRTGINIAHRNGGVTYVQNKQFADYETGEPRSLARWTNASGPNPDSQRQWKRDFLQLLYWLDKR